MATIDITTAATSELVAFFNAHTGGNPVKKFADRKTAERRVQALLDEMIEEVETTATVEHFTTVTEAEHAFHRGETKPTGTTRPEMTASLKLDRRIVCLTNGTVHANACQVWKAGLVSASQGDRLSSVLYGAAKRGDRELVVEVNGLSFTLEVK